MPGRGGCELYNWNSHYYWPLGCESQSIILGYIQLIWDRWRRHFCPRQIFIRNAITICRVRSDVVIKNGFPIVLFLKAAKRSWILGNSSTKFMDTQIAMGGSRLKSLHDVIIYGADNLAIWVVGSSSNIRRCWTRSAFLFLKKMITNLRRAPAAICDPVLTFRFEF